MTGFQKMNDPLEELSSLQKRESIRDRLKKRRQAIESLVNASTEPTTAGSAESEKPDPNPPAKRQKTDREVHAEDPVQGLLAANDNGQTLAEPKGRAEEALRSRRDDGEGRKREEEKPKEARKKIEEDDLTALLSMQSAKEREEREQQEEILTLLSKPTAREQSLMHSFRSQVSCTYFRFVVVTYK